MRVFRSILFLITMRSAECDLAIGKYPNLQQQSLLLREGELEDYYPLPEFEKAAKDLYGIAIKETTTEPTPTKESTCRNLRNDWTKKCLKDGRGRNEWKPLVAEEVVNSLDVQEAEAAFTELSNFLRKMHREIGTR